MKDINFRTSNNSFCKMYHESKREAISRDNFSRNSQRKHFVCTDRKDWVEYQNAVNKMESRKNSNMKRYESEIKDCKFIRKQFELQKQGLIPYGRLITGDQHTIKSSTGVVQEKALKSVRRALAPRTSYEASTRPVLNYELISKPPSVPYRIKIELTKREQRRLQEEEELNHVEERKPEISKSIYLDDAVAMYAKLRNEVNKEMGQRSYTSLPNKRSNAYWDTRPVSVPSKVPAIWNGRNIPDSSEFARVTLAPGGHSELEPTLLPSDDPSRAIKLLRNQTKAAEGTKTEESAHAESIRERNNNLSKTNLPAVHAKRASLDATHETTPSNEIYSNTTTPRTAGRRSIAFALPEVRKDVDITATQQSDIEKRPTSVDMQPASSRTLSSPELQSGAPRSSTLPELKTSRRNSVTKRVLHENNEENEQTQVKIERKSSIGAVTRSRRSVSTGDQLSTDKLQKLISEKIIGQITNAQRRHSISSNQKTSILKSYARMLQSELQLDEVPESDSPDFSETPFMRNTTKPNQEAEAAEGEEPSKGSNLWAKYLHYESFRSSLTYSEIEEEDVVGVKARRRLSATFFDSAGVITRKAKASKLKLKKSENWVHEEKEEQEEQEEKNDKG
ncbi:uncharacterized protein LOC110241579 [Exaiptasia diaphana]|uniref:Uncharacterized protein n=1 Tax=Exaiptasia diaphana TaxID=2652724 RepID=A0A913XDS6_EXADI|nr:uncharacterized protein LOC110241579 [Exaiptasia diaphana]KXJ12783.1 hypothetical protein AC249_AIPGENE22077 [Exaiptasia diaphana]